MGELWADALPIKALVGCWMVGEVGKILYVASQSDASALWQHVIGPSMLSFMVTMANLSIAFCPVLATDNNQYASV